MKKKYGKFLQYKTTRTTPGGSDEKATIDQVKDLAKARQILEDVAWESYQAEIPLDDRWEYTFLGQGTYGCVLRLKLRESREEEPPTCYYQRCDQYVLKWQSVQLEYIASYLTELFLHKTLEAILPFSVPHFFGFDQYKQVPIALRPVLSSFCPKIKTYEVRDSKQNNLYIASFLSEGGLGSVYKFFQDGSERERENFSFSASKNIRSLCFQLLYNLAVFEERLGFQHRDLNCDNVLLERADFYTYALPGKDKSKRKSKSKSKSKNRQSKWRFTYHDQDPQDFVVPVSYVPLLTDFGMAYVAGVETHDQSPIGTFGFEGVVPTLLHQKYRDVLSCIDAWGLAMVIVSLGLQVSSWPLYLDSYLSENVSSYKDVGDKGNLLRQQLLLATTVQVIIGNPAVPPDTVRKIYNNIQLSSEGKYYFSDSFQEKILAPFVENEAFIILCNREREKILEAFGPDGMEILSALCDWHPNFRPSKHVYKEEWTCLYGFLLSSEYFASYRSSSSSPSPKPQSYRVPKPQSKDLQSLPKVPLAPQLKAASILRDAAITRSKSKFKSRSQKLSPVEEEEEKGKPGAISEVPQQVEQEPVFSDALPPPIEEPGFYENPDIPLPALLPLPLPPERKEKEASKRQKSKSQKFTTSTKRRTLTEIKKASTEKPWSPFPSTPLGVSSDYPHFLLRAFQNLVTTYSTKLLPEFLTDETLLEPKLQYKYLQKLELEWEKIMYGFVTPNYKEAYLEFIKSQSSNSDKMENLRKYSILGWWEAYSLLSFPSIHIGWLRSKKNFVDEDYILILTSELARYFKNHDGGSGDDTQVVIVLPQDARPTQKTTIKTPSNIRVIFEKDSTVGVLSSALCDTLQALSHLSPFLEKEPTSTHPGNVFFFQVTEWRQSTDELLWKGSKNSAALAPLLYSFASGVEEALKMYDPTCQIPPGFWQILKRIVGSMEGHSMALLKLWFEMKLFYPGVFRDPQTRYLILNSLFTKEEL